MTTATLTAPPEPVAAPAERFDKARIDAAVAELAAQKKAWTRIGVAERIALLSELIPAFLGVADRWVDRATAAEGFSRDSPEAAEEWLTGPFVIVRNLRLLIRSLREIERTGAPRIPGQITTLAGGQVSARVFPLDLYDRIFYGGVTADVWMEPGVTAAGLPATQAVRYRQKDDGGVALVLGGGNVSSIGPLDALYKLFVEDRVVLYKAHPVNAYLGPLLEESLRPLARRGFFRLVYGGAEAGAYLTAHPGVDEIHITGSDKTYEAIVFGPGPEGRERRAAGRPLSQKPVSAELGNVSPVIVVPGPWSESDFAYHAESLATMLVNNAGFNCNATRVIVTQAGWPGRQKLLDGVRRILAEIPSRQAWYPGAADRFERFVAAHPEAETFGANADGRLPWTLIASLDPARQDDVCFTTEAFCGLSAEVPIEAESVPAFLDKAVAFANRNLWGTLNATLLVHPDSQKDPEIGAAVERALTGLHYGTVSVNHWAAIGYALAVTPWGAPPGHPPNDIQSGTGVVHNTMMFSRVQKTVLRSPFRATPKPVWFLSHRTARELTPILTRFEAKPSLWKLPTIFWHALRG
jgi:acyl-CoA reductase-like NAD-dependent aldehyde dehydrogenase